MMARTTARAWGGTVALTAALIGLGAPGSRAQDLDDYEYEPGEGLHEEEWYDPSDWFDEEGEGIDYEADDAWFEDEDEVDVDVDSYGHYYRWDPVNEEWVLEWDDRTDRGRVELEGVEEQGQEPPRRSRKRAAPREYVRERLDLGEHRGWDPGERLGYHFDWDRQREEWVIDYGWHDDRLEFDYLTREGAAAAGRDPAGRDDAGQRAFQDRRARSRQLEGEVEAYRRVELVGHPGSHLVARITLDDGTTRLVDLGPSRDLAGLGLIPGDRVTLRGRTGTIDDREVFMAERVELAGQRVQIDREKPPGDEAMRRLERTGRVGSPTKGQARSRPEAGGSATGRSGTVEGAVEQVRRLRIDDQPRTTLQVRLDDGESVLIDLGPGVDLEALKIRPGTIVTVRGRARMVGGELLFEADELRIRDPESDRAKDAPRPRER